MNDYELMVILRCHLSPEQIEERGIATIKTQYRCLSSANYSSNVRVNMFRQLGQLNVLPFDFCWLAPINAIRELTDKRMHTAIKQNYQAQFESVTCNLDNNRKHTPKSTVAAWLFFATRYLSAFSNSIGDEFKQERQGSFERTEPHYQDLLELLGDDNSVGAIWVKAYVAHAIFGAKWNPAIAANKNGHPDDVSKLLRDIDYVRVCWLQCRIWPLIDQPLFNLCVAASANNRAKVFKRLVDRLDRIGSPFRTYKEFQEKDLANLRVWMKANDVLEGPSQQIKKPPKKPRVTDQRDSHRVTHIRAASKNN